MVLQWRRTSGDGGKQMAIVEERREKTIADKMSCPKIWNAIFLLKSEGYKRKEKLPLQYNIKKRVYD